MYFYPFIRRILFYLPPEVAHDMTLKVLSWLNSCYSLPRTTIPAHPIKLAGITFPNRVGLAAGLDKNGQYLQPLAKLGFGFLEIGTLTPKPQPGNSKPRLFRLPQNDALINRMGFNNIGIDQAMKALVKQRYSGVLGINIGKNKITSNATAVDDYMYGLQQAYPYAHYIVVNISSPNTPNLRDLQSSTYLSELFNALKNSQSQLKRQYQRHVPLFVKVSPDVTEAEMYEICHTIQYYTIDGIIVANTTLSRNTLQPEKYTYEAGGLSGRALKPMADQALSWVRRFLPKPFPVIAVGGIITAEDALMKFELGADLVQLYTGLIYSGPALISQCIKTAEKFFNKEHSR